MARAIAASADVTAARASISGGFGFEQLDFTDGIGLACAPRSFESCFGEFQSGLAVRSLCARLGESDLIGLGFDPEEELSAFDVGAVFEGDFCKVAGYACSYLRRIDGGDHAAIVERDSNSISSRSVDEGARGR